MFILEDKKAFDKVFMYYNDMHAHSYKISVGEEEVREDYNDAIDYMVGVYLISDLKAIKGNKGHLEIFKDNNWIYLNAKIIDVGFDIEHNNYYDVILKVKENDVIDEIKFTIDKLEIHGNLSLKRYYINAGTPNEVTIRIIE